MSSPLDSRETLLALCDRLLDGDFTAEDRAQLEALARSGSCWASAGRIRRSLLHMHCNRLFGTDRDSELSVYAIAGNALRCQEARRRARQAAR